MSIKVNTEGSITLLIEDPFNGLSCLLTVRPPTLDEVMQYNIDSIQMTADGKVSRQPVPAAIKNLPPLVLGVEFSNPEMALLVDDKKGNSVPLSSNPKAPGYREDWYDLLTKYMARALVEVASRMYVVGVDIKEVVPQLKN